MIQMHYYFSRDYLTDDIKKNRSIIFEYAYYIPSLNKIVMSIPKNGSSRLQTVKLFGDISDVHKVHLIHSDDEAWQNPDNEIIFFLRHPLERFRSAVQYEYASFHKNLKHLQPQTYWEYQQKYYWPLTTTINLHFWPQSLFLPYDEEELKEHFQKSTTDLEKYKKITWSELNGGFNEMLKKVTPLSDSRIKYYHLSEIENIIPPILRILNPDYNKVAKFAKINESLSVPEVDEWLEENMDTIKSVYSEDINIFERLTFSSN